MNWPDFVKRLLLVDQRISEHEARLLKEALIDDGCIDREGIALLGELKREAAGVHPEFDRLLFRVIRRVVLVDGSISDVEARWLRQLLFADRTVNEPEVQFLKDLRRDAKIVGEEFERLYQECTQLHVTQFIG